MHAASNRKGSKRCGPKKRWCKHRDLMKLEVHNGLHDRPHPPITEHQKRELNKLKVTNRNFEPVDQEKRKCWNEGWPNIKKLIFIRSEISMSEHSSVFISGFLAQTISTNATRRRSNKECCRYTAHNVTDDTERVADDRQNNYQTWKMSKELQTNTKKAEEHKFSTVIPSQNLCQQHTQQNSSEAALGSSCRLGSV